MYVMTVPQRSHTAPHVPRVPPCRPTSAWLPCRRHRHPHAGGQPDAPFDAPLRIPPPYPSCGTSYHCRHATPPLSCAPAPSIRISYASSSLSLFRKRRGRGCAGCARDTCGRVRHEMQVGFVCGHPHNHRFAQTHYFRVQARALFVAGGFHIPVTRKTSAVQNLAQMLVFLVFSLPFSPPPRSARMLAPARARARRLGGRGIPLRGFVEKLHPRTGGTLTLESASNSGAWRAPRARTRLRC